MFCLKRKRYRGQLIDDHLGGVMLYELAGCFQTFGQVTLAFEPPIEAVE
jgi:hypothetical protein